MLDSHRTFPRTLISFCGALILGFVSPVAVNAAERPDLKTTVTIRGGDFLINGRPTYEGRTWRGHRVEGLLMNNRVV